VNGPTAVPPSANALAVGVAVTSYTVPLSVIGSLPSLLMVAPSTADVVVTDVAVGAVTVGGLALEIVNVCVFEAEAAPVVVTPTLAVPDDATSAAVIVAVS
jgi:hypothetical protein